METNVLNNETATDVVQTKNHVSFRECFPDGWRDYFRKEEVLLKVLEAVGLTSTHDFVRVNSRYLIDDHRIAIILLLKRKGTEILDKVIVDAIAGWTSFEQLIDVIYNIGADCDYRVVLYDENRKDRSCLQSERWRGEDWRGDSVIGMMLTSLLDYLSGKVSLSVMSIDLEASEQTALSFRCLNIESISKDNKNSKLPDRQILEKTEFWTNYFLPAHRGYSIECHEYCLEMSGYEEDGSDYISSVAYWGNDGMEVTYTFNEDDFTWIFTNKLADIEEIFKGCSISHGTEESRRTLKNDISVRNILNAVPDDEKNYYPAEHSVTICRPIPFRNFIYSVHSDRKNLAEEFAGYATLSLALDEWLSEREDEDNKEASPNPVANTTIQ